MRARVAIVLCLSVATIAACKRGGGTSGGGGGGGGGGAGWLVGSSALMDNVESSGELGPGYKLQSTQDLNGIACRYAGEAWVVGNAGTLLYTDDAGVTWTQQAIPTTNALRAIATQDAGPVYVGGDDGVFITTDTGKTWTQQLAGTSIVAISAAQQGNTVLALDTDGGLWSLNGNTFAPIGQFASARGLAVSDDGSIALVVGNGVWRSANAGMTWTQLAVDPSVSFSAARVGIDGTAIAVGDGGAIVSVDTNGTATVQHVGTSALYALHIPDVDSPDQTGYAAGATGQIYVTHDSGATWALGPNVGRAVYGIDEIGAGHL